MLKLFPSAALVKLSGAATPQAVPAGAWDVTSTLVDLSVPGVPGFLQRMARRNSKAERELLTARQGVEVLLAPDPKTHCRVASQSVAGGRYAQSLTRPQNRGELLSIDRAGTYNAGGFTGCASVTGTTPKGALRIIREQRAVHASG